MADGATFKQTRYLATTDRTLVDSVANDTGVVAVAARGKYGGSDLQRIFDAVGQQVKWTPRFEEEADQSHAWGRWLEDPVARPAVIEREGQPIGLVDVQIQKGGDVELVVFGLMKDFVGKGLGRLALQAALRYAWQVGEPTRRVYLHTGSGDHPRAFKNYIDCGFEQVGETVSVPIGQHSPKSIEGLGLGLDARETGQQPTL